MASGSVGKETGVGVLETGGLPECELALSVGLAGQFNLRKFQSVRTDGGP